MADHETIADRIAEKRRQAAEIERDCDEKMKRNKMISDRYTRELIADIRQEADRLEAALRRDIEAITPKPDPDWKDICAKCKDGDIEPKHCEYYGEPNGCNSPIYGEHPTAENLLAVGDAAKLREALETLLNLAYEVQDANSEYGPKTSVPAQFIIDVAKSALSAPPRNCDKYPHDQALRIWSADPENPMNGCFDVWLYAPATEGVAG